MRKQIFTVILLMLIAIAPARADELVMVRVKQAFPETMLKFQEVVKQHGYRLSRVQRVDIGLSKMGYKTDKYRVVFFGKEDQNRWIIRHHPELIAYLPLKVAIYAEEDDTLMVSANLKLLIDAKDPALTKIVNGWQKDMQAMFREMREYGANS